MKVQLGSVLKRLVYKTFSIVESMLLTLLHLKLFAVSYRSFFKLEIARGRG
jgi:hypothetical protein